MKITVDVEDVTKNLILTQHLAKGSLGEVEFDVNMSVADASLLVSIADRVLMVRTDDVVEAVVKGAIALALEATE